MDEADRGCGVSSACSAKRLSILDHNSRDRVLISAVNINRTGEIDYDEQLVVSTILSRISTVPLLSEFLHNPLEISIMTVSEHKSKVGYYNGTNEAERTSFLTIRDMVLNELTHDLEELRYIHAQELKELSSFLAYNKPNNFRYAQILTVIFTVK